MVLGLLDSVSHMKEEFSSGNPDATSGCIKAGLWYLYGETSYEVLCRYFNYRTFSRPARLQGPHLGWQRTTCDQCKAVLNLTKRPSVVFGLFDWFMILILTTFGINFVAVCTIPGVASDVKTCGRYFVP